MKLLPPPGPQRTRQLWTLGIVGVSAVVTLWQYFPSAPAAQAPAASNSPARPAAKAQADLKALPTPLEFGKLEPVATAPVSSRNPFRFGVPPPPPPAPRPVPPPVVAPPPPGPPPGQPPPPAINLLLRFEGRMVGPDGRPAAVLGLLDSSRTTVAAVLWATEGQVVDGRFRVVKIALESLVIEYVNGTGRTTIPLR